MSTTTNLANLADAGKPTKARAFELIKDLAEKHPESVHELAALYAYFMPATPSKPKTAFDWVAKAMGQKDVRYYLNYVYVTEHYVTATDGHRVHRIPNHDRLQPGFYNKAGDLVHGPEYTRYPDIERVIPNLMGRDRVEPTASDWPVVAISDKLWAYKLPNDVHVDKTLMDAALSHVTPADAVYVGRSNEAVRIMYKGTEDTTAIIMPMRV